MFSLGSVSEIAKQGLSGDLTTSIESVEGGMASASESEELPAYKKLAALWQDVNKPMPAAYAYQQIAEKEPTLDNWLKTGDAFTDSYQHLSDTDTAHVLMGHAHGAYEKARELAEQH